MRRELEDIKQRKEEERRRREEEREKAAQRLALAKEMQAKKTYLTSVPDDDYSEDNDFEKNLESSVNAISELTPVASVVTEPVKKEPISQALVPVPNRDL